MLIHEMWDAITTLFSQRKKKKKEISFYNHKNKEKFLKNSWQYEIAVWSSMDSKSW